MVACFVAAAVILAAALAGAPTGSLPGPHADVANNQN